jgi:hypothetical protein
MNIHSAVLEFLHAEGRTQMDIYLEVFLVKFLCERAENSTTEMTQGGRGGAVQPVRWHTVGHGHQPFQDHSVCLWSRNTDAF